MSRELDVQIAQKLFGIPLKSDSMEIPCPYYSSSSIHVCEILEALSKRGFVVTIEHYTKAGGGGCWVEVRGRGTFEADEYFAESLPLALCQAAIKAVG